MMSKIDRYDMDIERTSGYCGDSIICDKYEGGDWCKYEDVKELVEKLESEIEKLKIISDSALVMSGVLKSKYDRS